MSTAQTQQNPLVLYVGDEPPLPPERAASWALMGRAKMKMDKELQKKSLAIQAIFAPYAIIAKVFDTDGKMFPFKDWPAEAKEYVKKGSQLTTALADYRRLQLEMVDLRKEYTTFLDMAKEQCMSVEKLYDPKTSVSFAKAAAFELELRIQATAAANAASAKAEEIAGFTSHCKNEYFRIAEQYRQDLAKIVHDAYTQCLTQRTPGDMVHVAITAAKAAMLTTKAQEMGKYKRNILTDEEAKTIFMGLHKPDWPAIYKEALADLDEKFSLYENDLANAPAVIEQTTLQFNAQIVEQNNELGSKMAATTLMEQANSFTVAPAGMKAVTEITKIKILDNDQKWIVTILSAFLAHFQKAFPKVKVSLYSKLTVAQMAKALDDAGVKVEGVEYEEIKK